jgi:hypothetical protein
MTGKVLEAQRGELMADQASRSESGNGEGGIDPSRPSEPGMPLWVKISLIVVAASVLLFVVLHLTGVIRGHGLGPHMPVMNTL